MITTMLFHFIEMVQESARRRTAVIYGIIRHSLATWNCFTEKVQMVWDNLCGGTGTSRDVEVGDIPAEAPAINQEHSPRADGAVDAAMGVGAGAAREAEGAQAGTRSSVRSGGMRGNNSRRARRYRAGYAARGVEGESRAPR